MGACANGGIMMTLKTAWGDRFRRSLASVGTSLHGWGSIILKWPVTIETVDIDRRVRDLESKMIVRK
jgi:hypothetical protein